MLAGAQKTYAFWAHRTVAINSDWLRWSAGRRESMQIHLQLMLVDRTGKSQLISIEVDLTIGRDVFVFRSFQGGCPAAGIPKTSKEQVGCIIACIPERAPQAESRIDMNEFDLGGSHITASSVNLALCSIGILLMKFSDQ